MHGRILVVDDDAAMRDLLREELELRGYTVRLAASAEAALAAVELDPADVVVTDLRMPGLGGMSLCRQLHARDPSLPVILMTGFGSMDVAIDAIRSGAYDFLVKPFEPEQLALAVERAGTLRALRSEVATLRAEVRRTTNRARLHGTSPVMVRLRETVAQIAATQATVLVRGESGTGKELVSRELHALGPRAQGPFVAENLAAIPADLMESTLFGHVKGAFTGAAGARQGLLQRAHGGTLLLDEVGELPLALQPKLLRALEERRARPVGADHEVAFDVRIIAATHRDLEAAVAQGSFRRDLFFRLAVLEVDVPALRERGRDVLLLAQQFLDEHAARAGRPAPGLHPDTAAALLGWPWPGNVRELRNAMEHAFVLCAGPEILPRHLPDRLQSARPSAAPAPALDAGPAELLPLDAVEKRHILSVLAACGGNKAQAARVLAIGRKTLYRKLELWGELGADEAEPD